MRRIGLDLALRAAHRAAVFDDDHAVGRPFPVAHTKQGIDKLIERATAGVEGPCEFVMEPTGLVWIPLAAELARQGHRTYVPKPQKTHDLRKFYAKHTKTDGEDASAAGRLRHVDPKGVYELSVPTAEQTTLKFLVKQRARLVADASRAKQRIRSWLQLANPLLSDVFDDNLFGVIGRAFLRQQLDPFRVCERGIGQLRRFFARHARGLIDEQLLEQVWAACQGSCAMYAGLRAEQRLPFDSSELQQLVVAELDSIEFLEKQATDLEKKIIAMYRKLDPDATLLSVAGIGDVIAPALEALIGNIERFPNINAFCGYTGLVPSTKLTGGKAKPGQRMTKAGPDLLKQYLFLAAETARRRDPELAATYARMIARGKHHDSVIVIVAHQLARRIYAVLKQRAAYRSASSHAPPQPARYKFRHPVDATELTKHQARDYVRKHYPSKSQQQKAKTAQTAPASSGSSEDATIRMRSTPPATPVASPATCGNPANSPVVNSRNSP
jgi:transposase